MSIFQFLALLRKLCPHQNQSCRQSKQDPKSQLWWVGPGIVSFGKDSPCLDWFLWACTSGILEEVRCCHLCEMAPRFLSVLVKVPSGFAQGFSSAKPVAKRQRCPMHEHGSELLFLPAAGWNSISQTLQSSQGPPCTPEYLGGLPAAHPYSIASALSETLLLTCVVFIHLRAVPHTMKMMDSSRLTVRPRAWR